MIQHFSPNQNTFYSHKGVVIYFS